ncbi:PPME1, partial [Cordylochernes scorpioides]
VSIPNIRRVICKLRCKFALSLASSASSGEDGRNKAIYSPLPWNNYFQNKVEVKVNDDSFNVYTIGEKGPCLVLLHGGGYSGLTWALFSSKFVKLAKCQILAIDLRGHGDTKTKNDNDLSADILAEDVKNIIYKYFNNDPPSLIIIGHSMGGAIAIHAVSNDYLPTCKALVVIDVVEGTAMDALTGMQTFLRGRPSGFKSIEQAIEWALKSCQLQNLESARVSMPGQLTLADTPIPNTAIHGQFINATVIEEEEEDDEIQDKIMKNELEIEEEMTIAQMQGKFQMKVLSKTGHAIQEDDPQQVAKAVENFLSRNKLIKNTRRIIFMSKKLQCLEQFK